MIAKSIACGVVLTFTVVLTGCTGGDTTGTNGQSAKSPNQPQPTGQPNYNAAVADGNSKQGSNTNASKTDLARERKEFFARLQPKVAAASTLDAKLSVIVTDFCKSYMFAANNLAGFESLLHEELYLEHWRATAKGNWDANFYIAAGKSCQDLVPYQYRPKQPLSKDDFCADGRLSVYGCMPAG